MRLIVLSLLLVFVALDYTEAERSSVISSKSRNRSYSYTPNRSPNHNQSRNFDNKQYRHNHSKNTFNYNTVQQSYLNPYYLRNGYNPDILDPGHKINNEHYSRDRYPNYDPYYAYPAYNYPYYYDYGYDSSYYESDYPDENSYERDTLQQRDKNIDSYQSREGQPENYEDSYNNLENYNQQYHDTQYTDDEDVETVIYRWTDEEGMEHYTNNPEKIPDEFKNSTIEMETW